MVVDGASAEFVHDFVESERGSAFEKRIFFAFGADAVDYFGTILEFVDKFVDDVDVVLQIGIHRNGGVAMIFGIHETCEKSVLVTLVFGEFDAND